MALTYDGGNPGVSRYHYSSKTETPVYQSAYLLAFFLHEFWGDLLTILEFRNFQVSNFCHYKFLSSVHSEISNF